ncbi:unnamed protein product [Enterobius vermicularis]|uniref:Gamma-tubulin complex component n=1 Tax=Enterobius vermicularis TaxID=51028 RepID=A0A0N4VIM2_ENTVE|nr:unnamed protein product [Enterobius vermicularis]
MYGKIEGALNKKIAGKFQELRRECIEEVNDEFRGLTYKVIKRINLHTFLLVVSKQWEAQIGLAWYYRLEILKYEAKKLELISRPIVTLLGNLSKSKEQVIVAEEAFRRAQESHRVALLKTCDELDGIIKKCLELKSALAERNIKNDGRLVTTPAGDADTGDHSVLQWNSTCSPSTLSQDKQVSLFGSPFPSQESRYAEDVLSVRPLVFDESIVAGSPAPNCKSPQNIFSLNHVEPNQKQREVIGHDTPSIALPEMPQLYSATLRRLFENSTSENPTKKLNKCIKSINSFSKLEYDRLKQDVQSSVAPDQLDKAVNMLNNYLSSEKQGVSHLSTSGLMAILYPDFTLKQCDALHTALAYSVNIVLEDLDILINVWQFVMEFYYNVSSVKRVSYFKALAGSLERAPCMRLLCMNISAGENAALIFRQEEIWYMCILVASTIHSWSHP